MKEEQSVIDFAFASVVSISEIKKGEVYSKKNLWVKRPGKGPFYASDFDKILGTRATRDIPNDYHIKPTDIDKKL